MKRILFLLAILSGSKASYLRDVAQCTFMEYFCDFRKCTSDFFKNLRKHPGNCRTKFETLTKCVSKTLDICDENDKLSQSQIKSIVRSNLDENVYCLKGGLKETTASSGSLPCSSSFVTDRNNCQRKFIQRFAANKTDPELCSEYAKAKGCTKNLIASDCHFTSSQQEVIDLGLSDWNPFCENNRDPGATGKGQCDGVKKLNNPLHSNGPASAKMKVGVTYAFLIPFVLPLVFSSRM